MTAARDDEVAGRFRAEVPAAAAVMIGRLGWDRPTLDAHRRQALGESLAFAAQHSPWHAERLARLDIDSVTPDAMAALPVMTKSDLMANWDRVTTDPALTLAAARAHLDAVDDGGPLFLSDRHLVLTTGGSTGEPGVFCWSGDELIPWLVSTVRWNMADGAPPLTRGAWVGARSRRHTTAAIPAFMIGPGSNELSVPVDQPLDAIVARLNELQPDGLLTNGSMLGQLTEQAALGRLKVKLHGIVSGGDAMAPGAAEAAESAFGVRPVEYYPTTDVGTIASGTSSEPGRHGAFSRIASIDDLNAALRTHLSRAGVQDPMVRVDTADEIPRTRAGKRRQFVPLATTSRTQAAGSGSRR